MSIHEQGVFERIATAIEYINANYKSQPDLDEVAAKVHLSPYHFQRVFTEWAGVSPKKFLQFLTVSHAREMLRGQMSLFDTAMDTGLSGTGRLHDLFIRIEGMTPGEYKNGGESLAINYSFAESPFGRIVVASTGKGICYMAFATDETEGTTQLQLRFPNARYIPETDRFQQQALSIFAENGELAPVKLHLKGTPFQLKVWEALLKIPAGRLTTYGRIATSLESPNASRAVGAAIGDNPVAYLIPCHRVIHSTGAFGHYHWGSTRKTAMIGWEAANLHRQPAGT